MLTRRSTSSDRDACSHLANTASLLLPVSNLTNLLAFRASGLSFVRFGELMAVPWLAALLIEWIVLRRAFATELRRSTDRPVRTAEHVELPVLALCVVGVTLVGFGLSSVIGVSPAWIAAAGAAVLALRERSAPADLVRAAQPTFLVFVLCLGIVVRGASQHGLSSAVDSLLPHGTALPALLAVAAVAAVLANLVNNLPATLIILPVAGRAVRARCGDARGRQRRPQPDLRRIAGHPAVAADRPCARSRDRHR